MGTRPFGRHDGTRDSGPPDAQASQRPGRDAELTTVMWLESIGLYTVDHPATPTFDSDTGRRIEPDLGLRLGTGGPTIDLPDGPIDTLGEVKVQSRSGSAIDKIHASIDRYARVTDELGLPVVLFHDLDRDAVGEDVIDRLARLADVNLVGFVRIGTVTAVQLRFLVADLMRRRRDKVGDRASLLELLASIGPERAAALARLAPRHGRVVAPEAVDAVLW